MKKNFYNEIDITYLDICGRQYTIYPNDHFIYEAIELSQHWPKHQVTFQRVVHLRNWLRENQQHGHHIPFLHIKDMLGCKYFIDSVIQAEYANIGEHYLEAFRACLAENEKIFSD